MAAANRTYKKLAVQWLNEALYFVLSSVVADTLYLDDQIVMLGDIQEIVSFGILKSLHSNRSLTISRLKRL